jgi:hypothetical protein
MTQQHLKDGRIAVGSNEQIGLRNLDWHVPCSAAQSQSSGANLSKTKIRTLNSLF